MSRTNIAALLALLLLVLIGLFLALRPGPSAPDASDEGPLEEELFFELQIQEGAMVPDEITVDEGDRVVLSLVSDSQIEFHVHGYDLEEEIEPGEPVELPFDADLTGSFEIEDEQTQEELGELIVQPR